MRFSTAVALMTASFGSSAIAAVSQNCPTSDSNICYSLSIPDTTASSGSGDIFFQITAPSTYSWVALGQGRRMAGSNIFVIYTSADGQNVTLSPRLGKGNVMPLYDEQANVTLLEGSGVSNGKMTANVKCSNCAMWTGGSMDFSTSSTVKWIYGAKEGNALNSDDMEESISQHDLYDDFDWDLTSAKGGSDINPFISAATSGGSTTGTTTPQTTTAPSSQDSSSSSEDPSSTIIMAHAIMAAVAFAIIFPIGGIIIRVANFTGLAWVHGAIQTLAFLLYTAAFGLGIYIARTENVISTYHPIIGIIVFGILVFQPILGVLHHKMYKKTGGRGVFSFAHIGIGRVAIILGIINGGLGLRLANDAPKHWIIAYSVVAGVLGLAYIASAVFGESMRAKKKKSSFVDEKNGSDKDGSIESAIPLHQR